MCTILLQRKVLFEYHPPPPPPPSLPLCQYWGRKHKIRHDVQSLHVSIFVRAKKETESTNQCVVI